MLLLLVQGLKELAFKQVWKHQLEKVKKLMLKFSLRYLTQSYRKVIHLLDMTVLIGIPQFLLHSRLSHSDIDTATAASSINSTE